MDMTSFKEGTSKKEALQNCFADPPSPESISETRLLDSSTAIPLNYVQPHVYFKIFFCLSIKACIL